MAIFADERKCRGRPSYQEVSTAELATWQIAISIFNFKIKMTNNIHPWSSTIFIHYLDNKQN
jgi:hypothetical protein